PTLIGPLAAFALKPDVFAKDVDATSRGREFRVAVQRNDDFPSPRHYSAIDYAVVQVHAPAAPLHHDAYAGIAANRGLSLRISGPRARICTTRMFPAERVRHFRGH